MIKKEADAIVKACKKYQIFSSIRIEGDIYFIEFGNYFEARTFEAAKLITNAIVIEMRAKPKLPELRKKEEKPISFNRHVYKKRESTVTFGERHGMKE